MMTTFKSFAPLLPEILIAAAALLLLLLGALRGERKDGDGDIFWLAMFAMLAAAGILLLQPAASQLLFNEAFISDRFARLMKLLVLVGSAVSLLMALDYWKRTNLLKFEIPVLMLLAVAGMMVMISSNDLITLYLGLELQSLALYVLAAVRRSDVRASEAGLKYFVLGGLSSGMLLYGCSLIYGFAGSTAFEKIALAAGQGALADNIGLVVGMVFVLVGIAFKVSAVPFHMWTPDVYEGAPTPVTAFFAAAPKVAAIALLVRILAGAFPDSAESWRQIMVFLAIASMILGSVAAIGQTNIKRLMAYSSIGHVGFALVGLAAGTNEGLEAVVIYITIYLVMTLGAFACILAMRRKDETVETIDSLAGLAQTNLPMAFIFAMLLFSMAGIPPLAGFFGKFYVFSAAIKAELVLLAIVGVLASVVAAFYYLRIIKVMFFDEPAEPFTAVPRHVRLVMWVSCLFVLGFVVIPAPLLDAASAAIRSLRF